MKNTFPDWAIGPFEKYESNPVLGIENEGFDSWAAYNPCVTVKEGKFYMFYRAETRDESDTPYFGTSRIGLAISDDGYHFKKTSKQPIIDADNEWETPGGCEDPRIVKVEGVYHLVYTAYAPGKTDTTICHAVSTDLLNWTKKGPLLDNFDHQHKNSKSSAIVTNPQGDAVKVNGKYVMYFNGGMATSSDFEHWETFDVDASAYTSSNAHEVCVAITDYINPGQDDIVLFSAGNLNKICEDGKYFYAVTEALYSRNNSAEMLEHLDFAVIEPEFEYEKSRDRLDFDKAEKGTIFLDSIFAYEGKWWLHYGVSDQFVALATAPYKVGD